MTDFDFDEKYQQVLEHACTHLLMADDDTNAAIKRFLADELKDNPGLADDAQRVNVLVQRMIDAREKAKADRMKPAEELRL